jgi:hypothetical protein
MLFNEDSFFSSVFLYFYKKTYSTRESCMQRLTDTLTAAAFVQLCHRLALSAHPPSDQTNPPSPKTMSTVKEESKKHNLNYAVETAFEGIISEADKVHIINKQSEEHLQSFENHLEDAQVSVISF